MRKILVVPFFLIMILTGCAKPFQPVEPPVREADIYPEAQTHAGLTVAVDEMGDADRTRRYFGVDLRDKDILPVMIVFTNHDDDRFRVTPSDVLLLDGNNVIDPIPDEELAGIVRGNSGLFLQETEIPAKGSYRGIVFYRVKKRDTGLYSKVERLFTGKLTMRIKVNDLDSKERLTFGPFPLSGS
jgi:hypothetical protein